MVLVLMAGLSSCGKSSPAASAGPSGSPTSKASPAPTAAGNQPFVERTAPDYTPPADAATASPAAGSPGSLEAHIRVPTQVPAGIPLNYFVTLTNPTPVAVTLSPCPSYTVLFQAATTTTKSLFLNCDAVTSIAPGVTVSYALQFDVPAATTPGPVQFAWSLNTPTGPAREVTVDVS